MKCKCNLDLFRSAVMSSLLPLQPLLLLSKSCCRGCHRVQLLMCCPLGQCWTDVSWMPRACTASHHGQSWINAGSSWQPHGTSAIINPLILELSYRATSESTEIKASPFYSFLATNTVSSVFTRSRGYSQPLFQSIFMPSWCSCITSLDWRLSCSVCVTLSCQYTVLHCSCS